LNDATAVGSSPAIWTRTSNLLALARREHPTLPAEERVRGDIELGIEPDALQEGDRAIPPGVPPRDDRLGLAEPDHLALVEHLEPGRVA
jgi:hypothetical protein